MPRQPDLGDPTPALALGMLGEHLATALLPRARKRRGQRDREGAGRLRRLGDSYGGHDTGLHCGLQGYWMAGQQLLHNLSQVARQIPEVGYRRRQVGHRLSPLPVQERICARRF
jgi:hypothetical protein